MKIIVKECGRELHSKDGMRDMARCWMILDDTDPVTNTTTMMKTTNTIEWSYYH